jgi:hypothetical protein
MAGGSEFHVDSFVGVVHVSVSESDVAYSIVANRAYSQSDSTGSDSLDQNVGGVSFDSDSVVLAPYVDIVNMDVMAIHIKPIGVEGGHINDSVTVFLWVAFVTDSTISDF